MCCAVTYCAPCKCKTHARVKVPFVYNYPCCSSPSWRDLFSLLSSLSLSSIPTIHLNTDAHTPFSPLPHRASLSLSLCIRERGKVLVVCVVVLVVVSGAATTNTKTTTTESSCEKEEEEEGEVGSGGGAKSLLQLLTSPSGLMLPLLLFLLLQSGWVLLSCLPPTPPP